MLRELKNPENKPVFLFNHRKRTLYGIGGNHAANIKAASLITEDEAYEGERAQAIIFDQKQAALSKQADRDWIIVECVYRGGDWVADTQNEWKCERAYI